MGQHLGFAENSNMLLRYLRQNGVVPELCAFRLIALGPIEQEARTPGRREHDQRRDVVAAIEKALAELLASSGLNVMNSVKSHKSLDEARFAQVRDVFARALPQLATASAAITGSGRGSAVRGPGPGAERLGRLRRRRNSE